MPPHCCQQQHAPRDQRCCSPITSSDPAYLDLSLLAPFENMIENETHQPTFTIEKSSQQLHQKYPTK
jgi:hypothetical protein